MSNLREPRSLKPWTWRGDLLVDGWGHAKDIGAYFTPAEKRQLTEALNAYSKIEDRKEVR